MLRRGVGCHGVQGVDVLTEEETRLRESVMQMVSLLITLLNGKH